MLLSGALTLNERIAQFYDAALCTLVKLLAVASAYRAAGAMVFCDNQTNTGQACLVHLNLCNMLLTVNFVKRFLSETSGKLLSDESCSKLKKKSKS